MKIVLTIGIILVASTSYAQSNSSTIRSLIPLDTIQGSLYIDETDGSDSIQLLKKHLAREVNRLAKKRVIYFDSADMRSVVLHRTKFNDCKTQVLILLSGFKSFLLTLDVKLKLIDFVKLGENTMPIYDGRTGIGYFDRAISVIEGCNSLKSTTIQYRDKNHAETVVKRTITNFLVDPNGRIKVR